MPVLQGLMDVLGLIAKGTYDPNKLRNPEFNPAVDVDEAGNYINKNTGNVMSDDTALMPQSAEQPYMRPSAFQRMFNPEANALQSYNQQWVNKPIEAERAQQIVHDIGVGETARNFSSLPAPAFNLAPTAPGMDISSTSSGKIVTSAGSIPCALK